MLGVDYIVVGIGALSDIKASISSSQYTEYSTMSADYVLH